MKHLGLFEGIGGFSLAARWMGWETVGWCEWNEFGQKVLRHHFPEAEGYGDITKTDFKKYANRVDILTGGFPCQPYSLAGKRKGKEDERHLWPEMLRAIREVRPRWIVGENVFGLVNWNAGLVFNEVQTDLETEGYEVWPYVLPACAVNAPHRRDRVWFVAYANGFRNDSCSNGSKCGNEGEQPKSDEQQWNRGTGKIERHGESGIIANTYGTPTEHTISTRGYMPTGSFQQINSNTSIQGLQGSKKLGSIGSIGSSRENRNEQSSRCVQPNWDKFPTQSPVRNGDDGIPSRLDGITFPKWRSESIKAGGNAIVPQVAYPIFKAIQAYEQ